MCPRRCSARTRPTRERLFGVPAATPYPKDGINDHVVARRGHRQPGAHAAPRRRCATAVGVGRRPSRRWSCRLADGTRGLDVGRFRQASMERPRARGRRSSTRELTPAGASADEALVMRQALRRDAVVKAVLPLRRRALARGRSRRVRRRRPRAAHGRNWRLDAPGQHATSSRCPTSGSTRGTPPGTSPSTASRWRTSIRSSRRPADPAVPRVVHAPQRRSCPRTSGPSATSTRRCTHGRRCGSTRSTGDGDIDFLERVFHKLLLNFTWWVNRKDSRGEQPVRGRLPRARQHRTVRPLNAAGRGRSGAIRRDGVDGDVLSEPTRACARPRRARQHLRGPRDEVLRALRADRLGDQRQGAVERAGRLLLRPAARRRQRAPDCAHARSSGCCRSRR